MNEPVPVQPVPEQVEPGSPVEARADTPASPRSHGFGEVARQISRRTTDLIAVAILVVAGLAIGGRLTDWWRTEPDAATTAPESPLASPWNDASGLLLEFGDAPWTIERRSVTGDFEAAAAELLESGRRIAADPRADPALPAADEAETKLLASLAQWSPIAEDPGQWKLYAVGGPVPWIVGTRVTGGHAQADGPHERLVCWGIAVPQSNVDWTLYVIDRRPLASSDAAAAMRLALPESLNISMRIRSQDAGELVCFTARDPARKWMSDVDRQFAADGWITGSEWNESGDGWTATFDRRSADGSETAELTAVRGADGTWQGIVDHRETSDGGGSGAREDEASTGE